jgi:hypothetical protein
VADDGPEKHRGIGALPRGVVAMTRSQQTPGDYGYDLAHEELAPDVAPSVAPVVRPGDEHVGTPPVGGPVEDGEDFGYDEAHGF